MSDLHANGERRRKLTPIMSSDDSVNPLQQAEQNTGRIVTPPLEGGSTTQFDPEPRQLSEVSNVAADATESIARSARGNTPKKVKRAIVRMICLGITSRAKIFWFRGVA